MTASPTDDLASAERRIQELTKELSHARGELVEARDQQAATADILRVISSSPIDLQRVFADIAASASRVCDAYDATVFQLDGDLLHPIAHYGPIPQGGALALSRGFITVRVILDRRTIHIADMQAETDEFPEGSDVARRLGFRTILAVPLLRAGAAIGVISIRRTEIKLFSDRQVALLQTFADQAIMAIENARLFEAEQARTRELQEALQYQTATSDILGVISSSPTDLQHVMDTVAESAARVCAADDALIFRVDGEVLRIAALYGTVGVTEDFRVRGQPLKKSTVAGRAVLEQRTVHVPDIVTVLDSEFPDAKPYQQQLGFRTILSTPLLKEGVPLGAISIRRMELKPFTGKQIAQLETFADQAVIAIENTRLFEAEQASKRELQETLEYQTATSEVLSVISRSPNELQPVLDTILETAQRLCQSDRAQFFLLENGKYHPAAHKGSDPEFVSFLRDNPISAEAGTPSPTGRAAQERRTIHVPDVAADAEVARWHLERGAKGKSILAVPLIREGLAIGVITLVQMSVRPFTERQIDLVNVFADQAIIAIENTRLFEEVQARTGELTQRTQELTESLEYQTATSKVLSVIGSSPGDLAPVFDAMLTNAVRICEAKFGVLFRCDGNVFQPAATLGVPPAYTEFLQKRGSFRPTPETPIHRLVQTEQLVHVTDDAAEQYPGPAGKYGGARSLIAVPMRKEKELVGAFVIYRTEVRPFTDKQIELVKGFANQAVIAIENVRLLNELRESLQQQMATADVLKVISRSALDLQRVLDALVESAARLCDADDAAIFQVFGNSLRLVAHHGQIPTIGPVGQLTIPLERGSIGARAVIDRRTIHVADMPAEGDEYPESRQRALQLGYRTALAVPLVHAGEAIGFILIRRTEVRPFTKRQIELVNTFADQAVIAIENTRLFEEVQVRTRELGQALEYQTAISDVLGVIGRSKFDLQPVLTAIVSTACRLCDAHDASIALRQGEWLKFAAGHGSAWVNEEWINNEKLPIAPGLIAGRAILERKPIHIHDVTIAGEDFARSRELAISRGHRTALAVPLLREEQAIGCLFLRRIEVRPFSEKQVELLETFADQAVIAIENVRLFEEIARKSRELEIASQHKSQFVANMSHELRTPLAAILGYAELIQEGFYGALPEKSLDALTRIRSNGKHLLGLINTVLDIAKIESGQFTLNMSEYAIESVVETVRAAAESLAQNKKLTLKTFVAKSLPVGLGDEQRITQVLLNLVGNAIKFTDAGEVSIAAGARNGHFAVSVTDTGPGIPLDQQDRIFEQFHQVDSSLTKAKGGTGLGLAIAKQIVEMHGGRIWVESTPGNGSTFQMELPTRAEFQKTGS